VAVGEIGLDFWYDNSPREVQKQVFRRFLRLALELEMPVIIHLRDPREGARIASEAFLRIIDEEDPEGRLRGVLHCFSHSYELALESIRRGFMISFPGILTFPSASELRETASRLPRETLLVETDCPYLAPVPHRGKRNEPAFVVETARILASTLEIGNEELDQILLGNFHGLFLKGDRR
jgi:TatD DNase family protein